MLQIRHTGLVTNNIKKSLIFWVNYLKFNIKSDNIEKGALIDKVLGYKNVRVRTVKLIDKKKIGMLELLYFYNSPKVKFKNIKPYSKGFTHLSITVKDLEFTYKFLKKKKIRFNSKPNISADGKVKMTYCKTPEGVFLELVEVL